METIGWVSKVRLVVTAVVVEGRSQAAPKDPEKRNDPDPDAGPDRFRCLVPMSRDIKLERTTRFELATLTLAR